jgi:hypothetical protein
MLSNAVRMIGGSKTELTYRVRLSFDVWWEAEVFEPYLTGRRWFGLLPPILKYRRVFSPPWKSLTHFPQHPTPGEVLDMAGRAVRMYEDHKLAWETPTTHIQPYDQ